MKDVTVSFFTTGLMQVANIFTGLLAAWYLLPDGRGELAAVILWPDLIAELGNLGLHDALLFRAATRSATPRELFAASMALISGLSVLLIAIGIAIFPLVFQGHSPEIQTIALVFLCAYLPTYFTSLFTSGMFQGHLQIAAWNVLRALVPLTYLVAILLAIAFDHETVAGFATAYIIAQLVAAAVGLALIARKGWVSFRPRYRVMRGLVIYGAKVHVGEIFYSLRQRIDQALISLWLPTADLGIYAVALTVANAPLIMVYTLANVAFPKISQQAARGGKLEVFGRYLRFSLALALGLILVLWAVVPWLLPLVFKQPFAPAVPITNILLIGTLPLAAKLMFQQALKAWDRSLVVSRAELVGLAVAALAIVSLMPPFGLIGAAWSIVIAQFATALMLGFSLHRELRLPIMTLFAPTAEDWQLTREWILQVRARLGLRIG